MRLDEFIQNTRYRLMVEGKEIDSEYWQGSEPLDTMVELMHVSKIIEMSDDVEDIQKQTNARMPWADLHFEERVGGEPLNPPPSFSYWARNLENFFCKGHQCFSHSYPERLWSKGLHTGIRYDIADLNTLVEVLKRDPTTRQAYLPFFFPEDLSASLEGERVPCSLGWHFIVRDSRMDLFYALRSCDAMRHLHHDLYFANRLVLWVIENTGLDVIPGNMHFVATSMHCFKGDIDLFKKGIIK